MPVEQLNNIDEEFTSIIHDVWSHWQEYLHSKCWEEHDDEGITVAVFSKELFERWERQLATPYKLLPENEKQSDRNIFEQYYKNFFHSKLQEAYELGKEKTRREELYQRYACDSNATKLWYEKGVMEERERIIKMMEGEYIVATDDKQFRLHTDGYNNAIEDFVDTIKSLQTNKE